MGTEKYTLPLRQSIAPLYELLTVTGGLIPLTGQTSPAGKLFLLRYVIITLIGFGLISVYGFGAYIVVEVLIQSAPIQHIVLIVSKYLFYPLAIVTLLTFTKNREPICNFLEKWSQLEVRLDSEMPNSEASTKRYWSICILACCYCIGGLVLAVYLCVKYAREFPSFASYFAVPDSAGFYIGVVTETSIYFYAISLGCFGEFISAYTFRHLGFLFYKIEKAFLTDLQTVAEATKSVALAATSALSYESKPQGNVELKSRSYKDVINKLWERTEYVNRLVAQAQKYFGVVLFVSYATSFLVGCFGCYFIFITLQCQNSSKNVLSQRCHNATNAFPSDPDILILNFAGQLTAVCKLIFITKLCTSLPKQLTESQAVMSNALHRRWNDLKTEDKLLFWNFSHHLRLKNWTASPLDLFKISDSTLLSMYSLVITYVIVLLQTECLEAGP